MMLQFLHKTKPKVNLMQPELNFLTDIALQAGAMLARMQDGDLDIQLKGRADLVTRADKSVETFLIDQVLSRFPTHAIISEESGSHAGDPEHQWFIDPLDGTLNYAHGLRYYCTTIAYARAGQLQMGVIYSPREEECFTAELGKGAFLNGKAVQVSRAESLEDSLLATGFRATLIDTPRSNYNNFLRLSRISQGVRRLGSAAMDLAYVACGRLEGFWDIQLSPWDVAAGVLLVREAGGTVDTLYGDGSLLDGKVDILAANTRVFQALKTVLNSERGL
jgi:myo-inositol-1(or 4)-monophosphatase